LGPLGAAGSIPASQLGLLVLLAGILSAGNV
jgi:hypothetical protein